MPIHLLGVGPFSDQQEVGPQDLFEGEGFVPVALGSVLGVLSAGRKQYTASVLVTSEIQPQQADAYKKEEAYSHMYSMA